MWLATYWGSIIEDGIYQTKSKNSANPESLPRIQHEINIPEVPTTSQTVFTPEQNELFVQRLVQDAQVLEGKVFYYHILGLNESATVTCLVNTKTLWMWHDEWNISLWWFCVPITLFSRSQQNVRAKFWRDNCSHVLVSVLGIKLRTIFFSQYNPN